MRIHPASCPGEHAIRAHQPAGAQLATIGQLQLKRATICRGPQVLQFGLLPQFGSSLPRLARQELVELQPLHKGHPVAQSPICEQVSGMPELEAILAVVDQPAGPCRAVQLFQKDAAVAAGLDRVLLAVAAFDGELEPREGASQGPPSPTSAGTTRSPIPFHKQ